MTAALVAAAATIATAQIHLADETDRAAFRAWFVAIADAQFPRPAPDVTDCAALVRHAVREAVRPHTAEWLRLARLPVARVAPDVRAVVPARDGALALFRVSDGPGPPRFAEFADARTIVRWNATFIARAVHAAQPGDLLYFHQSGQTWPDHLMVFVGRSAGERAGDDWIVYHTGASAPQARSSLRGDPQGPETPRAGEVRRVPLSDLLRHPAPRWRPVEQNDAFVGVFRLTFITR